MGKLNYKKINCIFLIFIFLFESLDNALKEYNFDISILKNIILFIFLFICMIELTTIVKNKNRKFSRQILRIIVICIVFSILSTYFAFKQSIFSFNTIIAILKIFIPAFVAYVVLNTIDSKNINIILRCFLVFSAILYFVIILPKISIDNLKSISFINSISPFESNFFSPISLGLFIYFFYFDDKKWPICLSIIMILLNFKRPMILMAIFTLIFSKYLKSGKKISNTAIYVLIFTFSLFVYLYIIVLQGTFDGILIKYFSVGINKITMGRAWLLENTMYNYTSSGLGTSILNGRSIEMDLIMFYLEMGVISVITYIYNYYFMCERRIYNVWIVTGVMFICLTSHFYDVSFFWILFYITLGSVINELDTNNYFIENYSNTKKGVGG